MRTVGPVTAAVRLDFVSMRPCPRKNLRMLSRVFVAVFCLGFVFATGEADARSSGPAAGGRAASAPRSLQRSNPTPTVNRATQGLRVTPHRRGSQNRHFRRRWPFVFAAPYGVGHDSFVPPTSFAENGGVPPGDPVVINRRQCFVQPHVVPEEGTGLMRTVTVTRCY